MSSAPESQFARPPLGWWRGLMLGLFLVGVGLNGLRLFLPLWSNSHGPETTLLFLAMLATVAAFAGHLPTANIVVAGAVAGLLGGLVTAIDQVTGIPFGGVTFSTASGPQWLNAIPWTAPCLWFVLALNTRSAARFLLHQNTTRHRHGYYVLALSTILATLLGVGVATYGQTLGLWTSSPTQPRLALSGLLGFNLLLQITITPLVLDKFPHPRPANPLPLLVLVPATLLIVLTALRR